MKSDTYLLQKPDVATLETIDFPTECAIQPPWIAQRYPQYSDDHGMHHELTSVRTAEHVGHHIKITTTYTIEVDEQQVHLHALVGNDGRLHCHTTPYVRYQSAIDLVKNLFDRFPASFISDQHNHDQDHHQHDHDHPHEGDSA